MARSMFGGTHQDIVLDTSGPWLKLADGRLTLWDSPTGGIRYTDLLDAAGAPVAVVESVKGQVPAFQGPDGVIEIWADDGDTVRHRMLATDTATIQAAKDAAVAAKTDAEAAAASVVREQPDGVAGLDAGGKLFESRLPGGSINARSRLATPGATALENRAILQAAVEDAAAAGAPLAIRGAFPLSGLTIAPPSAVDIDASEATLTQTDNLRSILKLPSGSRLRGGEFIGKGTDWVNNSSVYDACAVVLPAGAADVTLFGVKGSKLAGAGLFSPGAVSGVRMLFCDFAGVGSTIIPATTGQYSGGLIINANGSTDIAVVGGAYRDFAQGLHGGTMDDLYVGGGVALNAVGQHAIYFGPIQSGVISGFLIESAALEGIKAQISDAAPDDGALLSIGQGVIRGCGSHLVHLANTETTPTRRHRRTVIADIMGEHAAGTGGDTILLERATDVAVHDVTSTGGWRVLRAIESAGLDVHHVRGTGYAKSGVHLNNVTDSAFDHVRLRDGSTANDVNEEWGFHVTGTASADLSFSNNKITDAVGNSKYLYYVLAGDLASMSFAHNTGSGASDYGYRAHASTATKLWVGNELLGTLGEFFNTPANAGPIADTSGVTLAALEAEVNKLKARMRTFGVVN